MPSPLPGGVEPPGFRGRCSQVGGAHRGVRAVSAHPPPPAASSEVISLAPALWAGIMSGSEPSPSPCLLMLPQMQASSTLWGQEWASCRMLGVWEPGWKCRGTGGEGRMEGRIWREPAASLEEYGSQKGCCWQPTVVKGSSFCPCIAHLGEPSLGLPG